MIAEAACSRSSLSEKAGAAGLFRQDTFPLRLRRGRGNAQGNLAAQGFRTRRTCRRVRIVFGGLRPSKPPNGVFRRSAAADGIGRGLPPLPASPQKCDMLNLAAQGFRTRRACRRVRIVFGGLRPSKPPQRGLRRSEAGQTQGLPRCFLLGYRAAGNVARAPCGPCALLSLLPRRQISTIIGRIIGFRLICS